MTYATADARHLMLTSIADATEQLGAALASLGEAYEQLDEGTAEQLEAELFRPLQLAYGRAQRAHNDFAGRCGLQSRAFQMHPQSAPAGGPKALLAAALEAVDRADRGLAELQDSLLPVEVGDAELRAGISEVRELLGGLHARARALVRTLGR
jgi:hypothetical protein